jgi:hypothetical protein
MFFRKTSVRRTRRASVCDWCGETIEAHDPSVVTAGLFEGDFFHARYHPECEAAILRWYEFHNCWGEELPGDLMCRGEIWRKASAKYAR